MEHKRTQLTTLFIDDVAYRETGRSFSFLRFIPRVNIPVKDVDSSTSFLQGSCPVAVPIFMSPIGGSGLGHPDGDFNLTRAASSTGISQCVSSAANKGISEVTEERDRLVVEGHSRAAVWWQLYVRTNRKESEEDLVKVYPSPLNRKKEKTDLN